MAIVSLPHRGVHELDDAIAPVEKRDRSFDRVVTVSHDLEGYFESLAAQGFQNNPFSRSGTKKWGLAPPARGR